MPMCIDQHYRTLNITMNDPDNTRGLVGPMSEVLKSWPATLGNQVSVRPPHTTRACASYMYCLRARVCLYEGVLRSRCRSGRHARLVSGRTSDNVRRDGERKRTFLIWYGARSAPKRRAQGCSGTFRTPRPGTVFRNVPNTSPALFRQAWGRCDLRCDDV